MKMFKVLFFSFMISILFCVSNALAIDLYGFGSYWDKKDVEGSWGAGLGLSLPLVTEYLRLDGKAYYFGDSDLERGKGSVKTIPFDLGLQVHILPSGQVDPYILGGVSYVYVDASDWYNINSGFGGYIGAGLDVELGSSFVKLFGEALYRFARVDGSFDKDIDLSGFTGNIGVKIHF